MEASKTPICDKVQRLIGNPDGTTEFVVPLNVAASLEILLNDMREDRDKAVNLYAQTRDIANSFADLVKSIMEDQAKTTNDNKNLTRRIQAVIDFYSSNTTPVTMPSTQGKEG